MLIIHTSWLAGCHPAENRKKNHWIYLCFTLLHSYGYRLSLHLPAFDCYSKTKTHNNKVILNHNKFILIHSFIIQWISDTAALNPMWHRWVENLLFFVLFSLVWLEKWLSSLWVKLFNHLQSLKKLLKILHFYLSKCKHTHTHTHFFFSITQQ